MNIFLAFLIAICILQASVMISFAIEDRKSKTIHGTDKSINDKPKPMTNPS